MMSSPPKQSWQDVTKHTRETGRQDCQVDWQRFIGRNVRDRTILDVGAGLGYSRERLAGGGNRVTLQEYAPIGRIDTCVAVEDIPTYSYDWVTAFDVIEHVLEDITFFQHLVRISREGVFMTTPNYEISKAANPHHVREYTPVQFIGLASFASYQPGWTLRWFVGDGWGLYLKELSLADFLHHRMPAQALMATRANYGTLLAPSGRHALARPSSP